MNNKIFLAAVSAFILGLALVVPATNAQADVTDKYSMPGFENAGYNGGPYFVNNTYEYNTPYYSAVVQYHTPLWYFPYYAFAGAGYGGYGGYGTDFGGFGSYGGFGNGIY
jgi:hypothetical protein